MAERESQPGRSGRDLRDLLRALAAATDSSLVDEEDDFDDLFDSGLLRLERDITDEYQAVLTATARDDIRRAIGADC